MHKGYSVGYGKGDTDPLEYLVRLGPAMINPMALSSGASTSRVASGADRTRGWRATQLVGAENGSLLKGLSHGPRDVANYRSDYSLAALRQLERSLTFEAAALAAREHWRTRKGGNCLREIAVLAISEKYFNICPVCRGSTWKKDRTLCKSCDNGFSRRSQRECARFLGMDHKNYARVWERRVNRLVQILNEWEDQVRGAIDRQMGCHH